MIKDVPVNEVVPKIVAERIRLSIGAPKFEWWNHYNRVRGFKPLKSALLC